MHCNTEDCSETAKRRGMCNPHYMKWWYENKRESKKSIPRHGLDTTAPEYRAWVEMKRRCYDTKRPKYMDYGGRGITVCDRWLNSYPNFLEDMRERPSVNHSLNRLDNNGDYSPSNCVWSTDKEQSNNRRTNHLLTLDNKTQTIQQWCDEYNIPDSTFHNRLRRGWSVREAITTPRMTKYSKY